jgi:hypothetical protein
MTFARRLCAATMALVLMLFPVALERCRTACVSGSSSPQASTGGHACHDMAADDSVTHMDPMARVCGHSDEARAYASASLVAGKTRTIVPLEAIQPLPGAVQVLPRAISTGWPPVRSVLPRLILPLDLPLRL